MRSHCNCKLQRRSYMNCTYPLTTLQHIETYRKQKPSTVFRCTYRLTYTTSLELGSYLAPRSVFEFLCCGANVFLISATQWRYWGKVCVTGQIEYPVLDSTYDKGHLKGLQCKTWQLWNCTRNTGRHRSSFLQVTSTLWSYHCSQLDKRTRC